MSDYADLIMVSYNSYRFLPTFFKTLFKFTKYPFRLLVIDNNSTDKSREYLSRIQAIKNTNPFCNEINLVFNNKDIGLAKAWNKGIKRTEGKYIVLLNTDIKLTDDWLSGLVCCAKKNPKAGVVGAKILNFDGTIQHAGYINKVRGHGEKDNPQEYNKDQKVKWVHGSCFLVKRKILPIVGTFDENFFVYGEEVDFCIRVRDAGFSVMYTPIPIYHYGKGPSMSDEEQKKLRLRSKIVFKKKWGDKK